MSFPGELWVPLGAASQQDFCSVGHFDTALPSISTASSKNPFLLMGVSATFPKNPGQATVWGQEGPERASSPTLSGRAGSFSLPSMQMFLGGGGPDPAVRWEPPASLCPEAETPDCEEDVHHVPRLTFGLRVGCKPASEHKVQLRVWCLLEEMAPGRLLRPGPSASESRNLLPLQDPSSGSPSSAR